MPTFLRWSFGRFSTANGALSSCDVPAEAIEEKRREGRLRSLKEQRPPKSRKLIGLCGVNRTAARVKRARRERAM